MALIDIKTQFAVNAEGKYAVELDSCIGVLQVEREKAPGYTVIEVYSYLPGMTPFKRSTSSKTNYQVDLEFHEGMKLLIVSDTEILKAKLLKED